MKNTSLALLAMLLAWPSYGQAPHRANHQNGGHDEISIGGLSGELADGQNAIKIQGRDVNSALPTDGTGLFWNNTGTEWQFTGAGNTLKVGKIVQLDADRMEDLVIGYGGFVTPAAGQPDPVEIFGGTGKVWAFDKASIECLLFSFEMPHSKSETADWEYHVHWMPPDTGSGTVIWTIAYRMAVINAAFPGSDTTDQMTSNAPEIAFKHTMSSDSDVTGGQTRSAVVLGKLCRNATADTYDDDAYLLSLDGHYVVDTLGKPDH